MKKMFLTRGLFFISLYVSEFQATAATFQLRDSETATNNQTLCKVLLYLESGPVR